MNLFKKMILLNLTFLLSFPTLKSAALARNTATKKSYNDNFLELTTAHLSKIDTFLEKVDPAVFDTLYKCDEHSVCDPQLTTVETLKKACEKEGIITGIETFGGLKMLQPWTAEEWEVAAKSIKDRVEGKNSSNDLPLCLFMKDCIDLPTLLEKREHAKLFLKSLVPSHPEFISFLRHPYEQTEFGSHNEFVRNKDARSLNRLFTYGKLRKIINENNLTDVQLPSKFFTVKDKKTNNYLFGEAANAAIDDQIKIFLNSTDNLKAFIGYLRDNKKYEFSVVAEEKTPTKNRLNETAREQLIALVKQAPFDMGYDNIFVDDQGRAIIIDTEYHGEGVTGSLKKLELRYFKN